jgi:signal transduction histidine kinase
VKLIGTIRDVSDRLRAEEFDRLREREKIQRELVATVSHELRSPIAAIHGFAETLAAGASEDPKARQEFIHTILRQSSRLCKLVEDLMTLSVLENGRRKPQLEEIDAGRLIDDLVAGMAPTVKKRHVRLRAAATPGLRVKGDPGQLTQALQNLVDNALKFSPGRTQISLEACRMRDGVLFRVADQGPGIPPDQLQRVFEPFHRAGQTDKVPGVGLGLAIVKQVVAGHGGKVWAENRPQGGCVFQFTLPSEASALPNPN